MLKRIFNVLREWLWGDTPDLGCVDVPLEILRAPHNPLPWDQDYRDLPIHQATRAAVEASEPQPVILMEESVFAQLLQEYLDAGSYAPAI